MSSRAISKARSAERKMRDARKAQREAEEARDHAVGELQRLQDQLNSPQVDDFLEAARREAVHQRERWGSENDEGKEPQDWFWLLGWLSGKAVKAAIEGDRHKALHHTISSAAVLLNWHAHMSGASTRFRPGSGAEKRSA